VKIRLVFPIVFSLLIAGQVACNAPVSGVKTHESGEVPVNGVSTKTPLLKNPLYETKPPSDAKTPANTPTLSVTLTPGINLPGEMAVVFVAYERTLNVYTQPGVDQDLVTELNPHATGIKPTGDYQWSDETLWIEVVTPDGATGWVDSQNLIEQVDAGEFCQDSSVYDLVYRFMDSIANMEAEGLHEIVSPRHGLRVRFSWWNPDVVYRSDEDLGNILGDSSVQSWGTSATDDNLIEGSFKDVILPSLNDAFSNYSLYCNSIEEGIAAGGSRGFSEWPFEYANINYISVYRPAISGNDLDWRTWALGVEFIDNQPYILALVQYTWEK
jgi:hypothetical protein